MSSSSILQELRCFRELGSVLYIAAHPDDENTRLIAYLARGRGYRTGYLSLTRGDGGQNLLGSELGEQLGVIRTQELLAARGIDGAQQFFTRAIDFGFSKDYRETLTFWDHQRVLADIVRIIRTFRPDVLITRFSTEPGGTHGHHTASAILALEAYRLAGDPKAFPEQLTDLTPWQPRRVFWNAWIPSPPAGKADAPPSDLLRLDVGGYQPLLGASFGEIAALSRSMHRSQGMGSVGARGQALEYFKLLAGDPATNDLLDGIDTNWSRFPGGTEIGRLADAAIAQFNAQDPAASVPVLLQLRRLVGALPADPVVRVKRRQLDGILQSCLGLFVETTVEAAEVVPGETIKLHHTAIVRTGVPVRWRGVRYPGGPAESGDIVALAPNQPANRDATQVLPADTPLSQPYWLRAEGTIGMYRIDDPSLIGRPENPPIFPLEQIFEVGDQTLAVPDEPVQVVRDPVRGEIRQRLEAIPPVSLAFTDDLALFGPGASRPIVVEATAARPVAAGTLRLAPAGEWQVTPAAQSIHFDAAGARARLSFTVTAPSRAAADFLRANVEIGGVRYESRRIEIRHDPLPALLLQPPAQLKVVGVDLAVRARAIGYLPGAGDLVAEALQRMGCAVTVLTDAELTPERLRGFAAVVVGIRAFDTRADLPPQLPALFAYVEGGGTLLVQYQTPNGLLTNVLAPYALKLSRDRVTDENAPVTLLVPEHTAFTVPNRLGPADFAGWVQERGLYFAGEWDAHFTPLLACSDPGEPPRSGALLVARYGRGYYIYTGLSFFRQLPDGVPGAYRLFANLLSLGQ